MDQEGQRGFLSFASRNKSWGPPVQQTHRVPSPIHHSKALSVNHTSNKKRVKDTQCPAQKVTGKKEDRKSTCCWSQGLS